MSPQLSIILLCIGLHNTNSFIIESRRCNSLRLQSSETDELARALQGGTNARQNPLDQFTNAYKKPERPKWYQSMDNIPFECTECGKCCQTKGEVYLNPVETKGAADLLNLSIEEFKSTYVEREEKFPSDINSVGWTVLKQKQKTDDSGKNVTECIFLRDDMKCGIYGSRPLQCSTYPFWPRFMDNVSGWNDEVVDAEGGNEWSYEEGGCEGMRRIEFKEAESESAENEAGVSVSEATKQLNMYNRYKKRFPDSFVDVENL